MKKFILALLWCTVVLSPCLLMFCQGGYSLLSFMGIDNGPYLIQLAGLLYSLLLLVFHAKAFPDWVMDSVDELVRDE